MADKAKAEAQDLTSSIASLKAEVSVQKQELDAQQCKLQAASDLKTQLSEVEKQLEEQRRITEAKEGQLQEAVSLKSRLAEVWSSSNLAYLLDCKVVIRAYTEAFYTAMAIMILTMWR